MRHSSNSAQVTLFPFLSVLLSTMGVLAFLSISFVITIPNTLTPPEPPKQVQFERIGAPDYVQPVMMRCFKDRIEYYDIFLEEEVVLSLDELMDQLQGTDPRLLTFLLNLLQLNDNIKKRFDKTEYYPLLLVYPDGILTSELLLTVIDKIKGLNVGLEPMQPHWEVPYPAEEVSL